MYACIYKHMYHACLRSSAKTDFPAASVSARFIKMSSSAFSVMRPRLQSSPNSVTKI